jgi:hypothetical protein
MMVFAVNVTVWHRLALSHAVTLSVRDVSSPPINAVLTLALENAQFVPAVTVPADVPAALPAKYVRVTSPGLKLEPDTFTGAPASTGFGDSVSDGAENGHCGLGLGLGVAFGLGLGDRNGVGAGLDPGLGLFVGVGLLPGAGLFPGVGFELGLACDVGVGLADGVEVGSVPGETTRSGRSS